MIARSAFAAALMGGLCLVSPAQANGLLDTIKDSANKVGEAAGDVARSVGNTAGNVANSVGNTVSSTAELVGEQGTPAEIRAEVDAMAAEALQKAFTENAEIKALYDRSAGYAVFDARNVNWGLAVGYGRGVAVSQSGGRTYMRMGTGGVGLGLGVGGFVNKVVMFFETDAGFSEFVTNGYDGTAGASSMVIDEKTEDTVRFVDGRSVFILTDKGLKVAVSAVGTKYWADKKLNQ